MNPLNLAADEVHTWSVPLDVPHDGIADLVATLTPEERIRSARFQFDRDRWRYVVAHGVLHDLLGRYLGIHPGLLGFVVNEFGRPELGREFGGRLKFNLSHSADLALIAVAANSDVGVDVERIRADAELGDIAQIFFSPSEVRQLNEAPGHLRSESFFKCWTQKEAYVKARGEGFEIPLTSFSVSDLHDEWSLRTLQPAPGYVGAVAIGRKGWRLKQWYWRS